MMGKGILEAEKAHGKEPEPLRLQKKLSTPVPEASNHGVAGWAAEGGVCCIANKPGLPCGSLGFLGSRPPKCQIK